MDAKFYRTLAHIALPIMAQEFINSLVNILDTFMIGSLGVHEITAVGLANQLFFLFILLIFGINSGAAILMGQYWGAEDVPNIKKTLGLCLICSVIAASLFSCFAIFTPELIMRLYSKDLKVVKIGSEYLEIIWISYILTAATMSFATALKSMRQTKIPMFTTIIALVCNAVLNYIFIYEMEMGVAGAAWATVFARIAELVAILLIIYVCRLPIAARFNELFTANWKFIRSFMFVAAPVMLNEFTWALGTTIYNVAYKYCGTEAQGALQISNSVFTLFSVVGLSTGAASGIMTANALGAGKIDNAIANSRRFMKLAVAIGAIMGVLLAVTAPLIVNIFNVSDDVKETAVKIMLVIALSLFTKMFNFTTVVGILRNGGDTWFCFAIDMVSVWLIGVPLAFLGAVVLELPVYYVFALVCLEELSKVPISGYRVMKNGWAKKLV